MATVPSSLLDYIAHGGPAVGGADLGLTNAQTQQIQAQTANAPLQGQLTAAQIAKQQSETQAQQLQNQQLQQQLNAMNQMASVIQGAPVGQNATVPQFSGQQPTNQVVPPGGDAANYPSTAPLPSAAPTSAGAPQPPMPSAPGSPAAIATPGFSPGAGSPPQGSVAATARPDLLSNPSSMLQELVKRGVPYQYALGAAGQMQTFQTNATKLTADQLANEQATQAHVGSLLQNLQSAPAEQRAAIYQQELPALQKLDASTDWSKYNPADPTQLQQLISTHVLHSAILGTAKTEAETKSAESESGLKDVQAKRQQMILDSIQQGQSASQNGQNPIDSVFPATLDPQINSSYKAAYNAAATQPPDEYGRRPAQEALMTAAANHAASVRLPNNPQVIQGEANKARAVEAARAPIELANQVEAARQIRAGDNPAVANVPIASQASVIKEAQGIDQDYIAAKSASDTLARVISDAKNPVAGANLPAMMSAATMAVAGIKRVPAQSIENNEAPGSLADTIAGKLQKWAGHGPIPSDIAKDMEELRKNIAQGSYQTYTDRLASLKRSGADFKPQFPNPSAPVSMKAPDGTVKQVTPDQVEHYKSLGAQLVNQ